MDKKRNYLTLKKFCQGLGISLFGVADISKIKSDFKLSPGVLAGFDRAVSLGVRLSQGVLKEVEDAPTRLYFHHYRTVNVYLDQSALRLSGFIQDKGFMAVPIPTSQILDWQNQTAHLSHKRIACLAGLGWIGRNNLLVNKKFGSQVRLVSVLTDLPLKIDNPLKENCGECLRCLDSCPAEAIKKDVAEFEYKKCFEKLKEFQRQRLVDQYICGVCVNVCGGKA